MAATRPAVTASLPDLSSAAVYGGMLLIPLYHQVVRGEGALNAGLLLVPQGVGAMLAIPLAGKLTDRLGPGRVVPAGLALLLAGSWPFTHVSADTSYGWLGAALFVRGIGISATMLPLTVAAYSRLSPLLISRAASTMSAVQQVGGSFGSALLVMSLTRRITGQAASHGLPVGGAGSVSLGALPSAVRAGT
jgi:MFS family permease